MTQVWSIGLGENNTYLGVPEDWLLAVAVRMLTRILLLLVIIKWSQV